MVIGAVLLSFVAFVCMGLGLLLTVVPIWGAVFAFGAPTLALVGIVLGGLAMSDASKRGQPTGFPLTAVIMNVMAFLPALVVALTCGVCNALVSSGGLQQQQVQWVLPSNLQPQRVSDAGTAPPPFGERDAATAPQPAPDAPRDAAILLPAEPSPALPPPPLAPGPSR